MESLPAKGVSPGGHLHSMKSDIILGACLQLNMLWKRQFWETCPAKSDMFLVILGHVWS